MDLLLWIELKKIKNKHRIEILTTTYLHNARFHYYEASQIFCVIKNSTVFYYLWRMQILKYKITNKTHFQN